ncbi:MAG: hypothetical protein IKX32_02260 [Bacteroidales bacterium]|nr:hypothetical protein [Bacteroidales bacterium]
MKNTFRILALAAMMVAASGIQAQKTFPAGIRMEVAESGRDNAQYTIFTYMDSDSTFGYYLSLGGTSEIFSMSGGNTNFSIADTRETCLWLGSTADEAFAMLDTLLSLYDKEVGTMVEFESRTTGGAEGLTDRTVTPCVVEKKLLGGKRLLFTFTSGRRQCGVYLTKSVIKELRFGLKTSRKLNPKLHR